MPRPMEAGSPRRPARLRRAAPYLVAAAWLALGCANLVRGLDHPAVAYRPWAFRHHSYSDLLAMTGDRYLGGGRPLPYLEDRVEYPVLLGVLLWAPSFLPGGQAGHFAGSVLLLAACLLASVWLLRRLPGAEAWWLAGTPAIAYYGALNWDLVPIALLLAALLALERGRATAAGAIAALGVSVKLWPIALAPAAIGALAGRRRWGSLLWPGAAFLLVTLAVNLPFAWLAPENWSWFFRFNGARGAENSVWELFRLSDPALLNALGAGFLAASATVAAGVAWRASVRAGSAPGPEAQAAQARAVRLGTALVLVVWIATNKVWSPQYALYAFTAGALAAAPAWLFVVLSVVSVVDYHVAFEVRAERGIVWFFDGWYYGEEVARSLVYAALAAWILREALRLAGRAGRESGGA